MDAILHDLEVLEEADQLCIMAARSLGEHPWITKQIDAGDFDMAKFSQYNQRMGGAKFQPQEKCHALEECLGKLSRESLDRLDDGCTVNEIYVSLQNELYKHVWRYHLCLSLGASTKPYFDRADVGTAASRASPACQTKDLLKDIQCIQRLRCLSVQFSGCTMHDPKKTFGSYQDLLHFTDNVFASFDAGHASKAFVLDLEVCSRFASELRTVKRAYHVQLAEIVCTMSKEALEHLKAGVTFDALGDLWHEEIHRRNRL